MTYQIRAGVLKSVLLGALFVGFSRSASSPPLVNQTTAAPPATSPMPPLPPSCFIGKDYWNICWLNAPPYVYNNNPANHSTVIGILIEALIKGLKICNCSTKLNFMKVDTLEELQNCSKSENIDIVLPLPRKKAAMPSLFFTVVDSPNIYLLLNQNSMEAKSREKVISEFLNSVWPIAVLTVLLALIFGIIVWFLDMTCNQEQFPPTFFPGSLEGIWWSFVTLTTVGYGDKTPKFPIARLFAVVWMFLGMGMVSLLTATMTKALTQSVFDYQKYFQSQKIDVGIIKHSYTYDEAVKKGAKPVEFSDLSEMYTALDNNTIGGIFVDIFVATYVRNNPSRFKAANHIFVAHSYDVAYPLAFYLGQGAIKHVINPDESYIGCFQETFPPSKQVINIYEIVEKYIQPPQIDGSTSKSIQNQIQVELYLFKSTGNTFLVGVQVFGGTLGVLILMGIIWQACHYHRFKSKNIVMRKGDKESVVMVSHYRKDITKLKMVTDKLEEVDKALGKLSEFREVCEQYKIELQRYDAGVFNNGTTTHAPSATTNQGFTR